MGYAGQVKPSQGYPDLKRKNALKWQLLVLQGEDSNPRFVF